MRILVMIVAGALFGGTLAASAFAYQREKHYKNPHLPGIIHSASCKELAPGVYDCGDHKNHGKVEDKRSDRWSITYRPTDDVTIKAQSKAEREARKQND